MAKPGGCPGLASISGVARLDCRLRICDATACCGIGLTLVHWVGNEATRAPGLV